MSGKGDKQRPTDRAKFDENYERIFGKKELLTDAAQGKPLPSEMLDIITKLNKKWLNVELNNPEFAVILESKPKMLLNEDESQKEDTDSKESNDT